MQYDVHLRKPYDLKLGEKHICISFIMLSCSNATMGEKKVHLLSILRFSRPGEIKNDLILIKF